MNESAQQWNSDGPGMPTVKGYRMHMAGIRRSATWIVVVLFIAIPSAGSAQTQYLVTPEKLTRGKMWIKANPNGSLEREQSMAYDWEMAYPGSWDHRNEASGGWDNNAIYHGAQLAGEDVSWMFRNGPYDDADMYSLTNPSTVLVKHYNLVNPNAPEEYLYGTFYSPKYDARGKRHMSYRLEGRVMAWGHPKYDDFVIVRCRLTNTDDVPLADAGIHETDLVADPMPALKNVEMFNVA